MASEKPSVEAPPLAPTDTVKQIVVSNQGDVYALSHTGRIFGRHKDSKHMGPGEPPYLWREIVLPVL